MGFKKKMWTGMFAALFVFGSVFAAEKADIVVAKSGGDFTTIQAAINSVSSSNSSNVTILIKNGTYEEHIVIDKSYITLVGESKDNTIIQYSIERTQWNSTNGSNIGCAVVNIGCSTTYTKVSAGVTDIVIANLTVVNTYDDTGVKTMAIKDEGNSVKVFIVNCNVWSQGHDTISLWNKPSGMYYHADCSFKGALDYVCPRGWCYIVNSDFYNTASSAPLWHEARTTQKFTVRNGRFKDADGYTGNFKLLNQNTPSDSVVSRFYLLDCMISSKCNTIGAAVESYFYNCHGESSDQTWYKDNLPSSVSNQSAVTVKWTFDNNWDPENTMPSVLPMSCIPQPWTGAYDVATNVELKWIMGRNATTNAVYFGTDSTALSLAATQTTTAYSPANLSTGTTYYWRVDAVGADATVTGTVWSFKTSGTTAVKGYNSAVTDKVFSAVQNNGTLQLAFTLDKSETVVIKMFNLQGKEILSLPSMKRDAGTYTESLLLGKYGVSKGKYVVSLNAGTVTKRADIIIQ